MSDFREAFADGSVTYEVVASLRTWAPCPCEDGTRRKGGGVPYVGAMHRGSSQHKATTHGNCNGTRRCVFLRRGRAGVDPKVLHSCEGAFCAVWVRGERWSQRMSSKSGHKAVSIRSRWPIGSIFILPRGPFKRLYGTCASLLPPPFFAFCVYFYTRRSICASQLPFCQCSALLGASPPPYPTHYAALHSGSRLKAFWSADTRLEWGIWSGWVGP